MLLHRKSLIIRGFLFFFGTAPCAACGSESPSDSDSNGASTGSQGGATSSANGGADGTDVNTSGSNSAGGTDVNTSGSPDAGGTSTDTGGSAGAAAGDTGGSASADNGTTSDDDYYPLVDGAEWVYRHSQGGQLERIETTRMELSMFDGRETYFVFDPNRGDFASGTDGHLVKDGTMVMRIHKTEYGDGGVVDFEVDYDPGFPRFDSAWIDAGGPVAETYMRTDTNQPDMPEPREQIYTVLGTDVPVTVPAGTFMTVHVERERSTDSPTDPEDAARLKHFWFAAGVGKVKEEHLDGTTAGKVEELQSCTLPACS